MENQLQCWRSAQTIHEYFTTETNATKSGSGVHETLKRMHAADRAFVDSAGTDLEAEGVRGRLADPFSVALGALKSAMGQHIAVLAEQDNVTVDRELAEFPAAEAKGRRLASAWPAGPSRGRSAGRNGWSVEPACCR
jgi:hypothetical protein